MIISDMFKSKNHTPEHSIKSETGIGTPANDTVPYPMPPSFDAFDALEESLEEPLQIETINKLTEFGETEELDQSDDVVVRTSGDSRLFPLPPPKESF